MLKKVQMRGGARRPHARRSLSTLSVRPRAPTKQMGLFQHPALDLLEVRVLQRQALAADAREVDGGDHVAPLALQADEEPLAIARVAQLGAEAEREVFAGVGRGH